MNTTAIPSNHPLRVASRDAEPDQLHDARRARVDEKHTARTRGAGLCIQHDRASHRRLEDDAPSDAELGVEEVRAEGEFNVADGCVGECTLQFGGIAHRGLQLTAVAGHGHVKGCRGRALGTRAQEDGQANHGFRTDGLYPLVFAMCERFANDLSSHTQKFIS